MPSSFAAVTVFLFKARREPRGLETRELPADDRGADMERFTGMRAFLVLRVCLMEVDAELDLRGLMSVEWGS